MTITAFRVTRQKHAPSIWSGIGARDYGGRWNSHGVAVVYTAENRSLAAMEQLVQLIRPRMVRGFVIASIQFEESQADVLDPASLPIGWNAAVAPPELRRYGDEWVAAARFAVLAVPSAVMPGELNYLINPAHPEFELMVRTPPVPFRYDERLG